MQFILDYFAEETLSSMVMDVLIKDLVSIQQIQMVYSIQQLIPMQWIGGEVVWYG